MSSSTIPCRAPYVSARISPNAKKVTIKVGQGVEGEPDGSAVLAGGEGDEGLWESELCMK